MHWFETESNWRGAVQLKQFVALVVQVVHSD